MLPNLAIVNSAAINSGVHVPPNQHFCILWIKGYPLDTGQTGTLSGQKSPHGSGRGKAQEPHLKSSRRRVSGREHPSRSTLGPGLTLGGDYSFRQHLRVGKEDLQGEAKQGVDRAEDGDTEEPGYRI